MSQISLESQYQLSNSIRHREIDNCIVIVDQKQNLILELNESASFIFKELQLCHCVSDLCQRVHEIYLVEIEAVKKDVFELLTSLLERNLIVELGKNHEL